MFFLRELLFPLIEVVPVDGSKDIDELRSSRFAAGKPTALVLDVGYSMSCAVPIVDGYALRAGLLIP